MGFVYILWAAAALALLGVAGDVWVLRQATARAFAWSAIGIKLVVATGFASWFVALRAGAFSDWADLATLTMIMLVSVPLLGIALVCDAVAVYSAWRAIRNPEDEG